MKKVKCVLFASMIILIFLIGCNNKGKKVTHVGKVNLSSSIKIDSTVIDVSYTSGRGNFYMIDSLITFADAYSFTLYSYNNNTGKLISKHFRKGHGPNELNSFMYVYPDSKSHKIFILDSSYFLSSCDSSFNLVKKGVIDFGWKNNMHHSSDFNTPRNYKIMEMSDFDMNLTYINDSILMIPVNVIHRKTSQNGFVNSKEYDEGHIFGLLNLNSMKVKKVLGKYPYIYKTNPVPHMDFFQYSMKEDTIYVNHAIDSLIYVYKYPDKLLYTFGYECNNINRNYTVTKKVDHGKLLKNDTKKCGMNIGLKYISQTNLLLRTYMLNLNNGESGLQIYKDNNLIGDFKMPRYFKLLGYCDKYYYGVRLIPIETRDITKFVFYKFKIQ